MMDIHRAFRQGAEQLAKDSCKYTDLHKGHGIDIAHWELLTQNEYWTPDQARSIRTVLASVAETAMTISGMPAIPLPGQYMAALIATVVAPINRLVACTKAPETFDAESASGILQTHEVKPMSFQQLSSLVMAYSGGYGEEPIPHKLPEEVSEQMKFEAEK